MKAIIKLFVLILLFSFISDAQQETAGFLRLTGPYLGQKPPGNIPESFASDLFSSRFDDRGFHTIINFSHDNSEAYWRAREKTDKPEDKGKIRIFTSKLENSQWTIPEHASFSLPDNGDDTPFISPDGNRLFFISMRPLEKASKIKSDVEKIWYVDKTPNGWSEPILLPPIINSMRLIHWGISVDNRNNLYIGIRPSMSLLDGYLGDIYCSKYLNGQYSEPEKLPYSINIPGYKFSPFIAPDGSYILFTHIGSKEDHYKILIGFRKENGNWTLAKEINDVIKMNNKDIINPYITPDGKYLIFQCVVGGRTLHSYWIDASFIEDLRKTVFNEN